MPYSIYIVDLVIVTIFVQVSSKKCWNCRGQRQYYIPRAENCPGQLANLSEEARRALSPIEINTGRYVRASNGYRMHASLMRLSWKATSVKKNIKAGRFIGLYVRNHKWGKTGNEIVEKISMFLHYRNKDFTPSVSFSAHVTLPHGRFARQRRSGPQP